MSKIKVKSENLPLRCEICHQSDFFEPSTGICSRCAPVNLSEINLSTLVIEIPITPNIKAKESIISEIYFYLHKPAVLMSLIIFGLIFTFYLMLFLFFNFAIWRIEPVLTSFAALMLLSPIFLMLFGLIQVILISWYNIRSFNRSKKIILFRFSEKGFNFSTGETFFNLPWNHFKGVYETPYDLFVITKSKTSFKFAKKLISETDYQSLRNLFKIKFGKRAKLK